jgi:cytochrome c5
MRNAMIDDTMGRPLVAALLLALAAAPDIAAAQSTELSGKEIVDAVCASCHAPGAQGAPRIGDRKAWSKRASQGLSSLTEHAIHGIRAMPAHGGNPGLTEMDLKRAITYMVNQSGGHWFEPTSKTAKTPDRTGEQIVQARCAKCHEKGEGGAPKIGDQAAWIPRVKQGLDVVVRSAINGHGAMPARGGQADLTDSEMRSAVIYMFNKGTGK